MIRALVLCAAFDGLIYAVCGLLFLGRWDFLAGVGVFAVFMVLWGYLGWVEDRRVALRRGRDLVWQRRVREAQARGERVLRVVR